MMNETFYPQGTMFNDKWHEVCQTCGCTVGHGCPESEHCNCDDGEEEEIMRCSACSWTIKFYRDGVENLNNHASWCPKTVGNNGGMTGTGKWRANG